MGQISYWDSLHTIDTLSEENEGSMTIRARLGHWKEQGAISPEQHVYLASLCRGEPFSVFLELNVLLYAGVLAFVVGLGWTVSTWSQQLGDVLVLGILSTILGTCFWYCFSRAPAASLAETPAPTAVFDYVLYLGSLVWCVELAYLEKRFHALSGQWGPLSLCDLSLFFLSRVSSRQSFRAVARSLVARGMVRAHHLALAVSSGRGLSAICPALLPAGRLRRDASSTARSKTSFFWNVSERRGQRFILGITFWRIQSSRLRGMVPGLASRLWRGSRLGPDAAAVCLRCLFCRLRLRGS